MGRPLDPADRAILELEGPGIAGHACKLIVLGGKAPGIAAIRERITERLPAVPQLRRRLGGSVTAPEWVDDAGFRLDEHVAEVLPAGESPLPDPSLDRLVARLFAERLDRDRPLWRIDVAPLESGRVALIWRLHHALADGTTAIRWARQLLWDQTAPPAPAAPAHAQAREELDHLRRTGQLAAFVQRELAPAEGASPFDGVPGSDRSIGFARIELQALHDAARRLADATINDALLAIVAGAIRGTADVDSDPPGDLRLRVPVSLHTEDDDAANADSFFTVPVPMEIGDPAERLRTVRELTSARKSAHDAVAIAELLAAADPPPGLAALAKRLETGGRGFALCISNVPGPRDEVSVLGAPVERLGTLAEIGRHHCLRIGCISLAGRVLELGVCADAAIVGDAQPIVRAIEREAAALIAG